MKTLFSFQDESHRVQLVVYEPVGLLVKYVIFDNRKVVHTYFNDEANARRFFHLFVSNFILQTNISSPN